MPIPLFNYSKVSEEQLLGSIRKTGFIAEAAGDLPAEESGLWDLVAVVPSSSAPASFEEASELVDHATEALSKDSKWDVSAVVVADERTEKDGSVLVCQINTQEAKGKRCIDTMRVAFNSVIEVVSSLLSPYRTNSC